MTIQAVDKTANFNIPKLHCGVKRSTAQEIKSLDEKNRRKKYKSEETTK